MIGTLKTSIDEFIALNADSIDTSRIYIAGYSLGGKMTARMAESYHDFFAACAPLSPVYTPVKSELDRLKDMPVWLFVSTVDNYTDSNSIVVPNWNYLTTVTSCPERIRITAAAAYYNQWGTLHEDEVHNTWNAACCDMFMANGNQYMGTTIKDGNGNTVKLQYPNGLISWLSAQNLGNRIVPDTELTFFQKISKFFSELITYLKNIFNAFMKG